MNHNQVYMAALMMLAAMTAASGGLLLFLTGASSDGSAPETLLPAWSMPWVAIINVAYTIAIMGTLCARFLKPAAGRQLTRLLNWALLPALPGGTIVGLYGLMMVDRNVPNARL